MFLKGKKMDKIKKSDSNNIKIFEKDDQFWVTSLEIAEKFNKKHSEVLEAINNLDCSDSFKSRNFLEFIYQDEFQENQKGYNISRDGFSYLGMTFKGKEAAEWREEFLEAFNQMEQSLREMIRRKEKRLTLEWKQLREDGKSARRIATDAYKEFEELAKKQGTTAPPGTWFMGWTELAYDAVIPGGRMEIRRRKKELRIKNGRDTMSPEELISVMIMETAFIKPTIKTTMKEIEFYKDIRKEAKKIILQYGEMIKNNHLLQNDIKILPIAEN